MDNRFELCRPEPSCSPYWSEMHDEYMNQEKQVKNVNILLTGASIMQLIQETKQWEEEFAPLNSINFGISGERVENLIYRLEHGALDTIKAKVIAFMIGSNNVVDEYSNAEDIAAAIYKIAQIMRTKQPDAYIVSMSITPKGYEPNFTRGIINKVNSLVEASIGNNGDAKIMYLRCDEGFINPTDGTLDARDYTDWLHLTESGYRKFLKPLISFIKSIL